jgi:flagellar biosynthesis anti-sigma factor FlgM
MMKIKTGDTPDAMRMDLNPTRGTREAGGLADSKSVSPSPTTSGDSIALSGTTGLVQQAIVSGADVRAARVLELQKQVRSGQYQVDATAVSRAMIEAHLAGE